MTNLVKGLSVELATILVATIIGTYTFIGGLGATFYVSYFNTSIIYITMLVFLVKVYHDPDNVDNPIGERICHYSILYLCCLLQYVMQMCIISV